MITMGRGWGLKKFLITIRKSAVPLPVIGILIHDKSLKCAGKEGGGGGWGGGT